MSSFQTQLTIGLLFATQADARSALDASPEQMSTELIRYILLTPKSQNHIGVRFQLIIAQSDLHRRLGRNWTSHDDQYMIDLRRRLTPEGRMIFL